MATSVAIHLLTAWGFSEEVIGHFIAQEIEVDQFKYLTEEDLKTLIPNIGPRRKFQNNVKEHLNEIAQQSIENVDPNNQQPQATQDLDYTNISIKRQKRDIKHDEDNELNKSNNISNITENIFPTSLSASSTSASTGYDVIFLTSNATSATEIKQYAATDNKYNLKSIFKRSEDGQLLLSLYQNEGRLNNDQRNKLAKIIVSNELSPNISNTICSERASFLSDHVVQLFPTEDKSV
ncbi:uncharacterized protein LOC115245351 isoform X1 [Formica exsecta]|uniref:uncharacterized protein LOC115245351 isoform X1 n=1 Tax=Formica exsecta TaxID=72781 RepID=UPI00114487DA|nr:uncharacterized protein LOC115245351 isoform X1 [Formica exsecta]